jgi:hypothetical protein
MSAVVLVNVLGFYDPLRTLIHSAIRDGFIEPANTRLVLFVDGPPNLHPNTTAIPKEDPEWIKAHEEFDWGTAALKALDEWDREVGFRKYPFDWGRRRRNADAGADVDQDEGGLAGA